MAVSALFRSLAAVLNDARPVIDTYSLLDAASVVNEVAVKYGAEEYDKGYSAGRDAEAAKHAEPLDPWERKLLSKESIVPLDLSIEEARVMRALIGSHCSGNHPALMPLWGKIERATENVVLGEPDHHITYQGGTLGGTLRIDKR